MNRTALSVLSLCVLVLFVVSSVASANLYASAVSQHSFPQTNSTGSDPSVSIITTVGSEHATSSSPERKVFNALSYWWVFWDTYGTFSYSSSSDGSTWSTPVEPTGFSSELSFSVWVSGSTVYYAASNGVTNPDGTGSFYYNTGTLNSDGTITWATESIVSTQYPTQGSVSVITDTLGDPWVNVYTEDSSQNQYAEVYELTGGSWILANSFLGGDVGDAINGWVQVVPLPAQDSMPNVAILYSFEDCDGCFTGTHIAWTTGFSDGSWSWSSAFNVGAYEEDQVNYAEFSATAIGDTVYVAGSAASGDLPTEDISVSSGIWFSSWTIGESGLSSIPVLISDGEGWDTPTPTDVSISQGAVGSSTLVIFYNYPGQNLDYSVSTDLGASGSWTQSSIFSTPQTSITAVNSADSATTGGEIGVAFVNYEEVFDLDFATVTTSSTSAQITANLQDGFSVNDTYATGTQAPLSDGLTVSDQYIPPATASLSDGFTVNDVFVSPVTAALTDALSVADTYVRPVTAALTDAASFGEILLTSLGLPVLQRLTITVDPGYVLITAPNGGQAGCDANGNVVNTISGATVTSCSRGTETITIPNPAPGTYVVQISAFGSSSSFTITFETTDLNENQLGSSTYSGTVNQGSPLTVYSTIGTLGQITISSSPLSGVPEFPGSVIIVVVAIVLLSLNYVWKRKHSF